MINIKKLTALLLLVLSSVFFIGCPGDNNPVDSSNGNIKMGGTVNLTTRTVGSNAFTIEMPTTADTLKTMKLEILENSFTQTKTFEISYTKIESHNLGPNFNPVTPLIKISNGGGYADRLMKLKIPINIAEDEIPVGFFYDDVTGKLEAIPFLYYGQNSITLATRHFGYSETTSSAEKKNGSQILSEKSYANIVISVIKKTALQTQSNVNTGFTPGVDDWEITNYGSYLTEGNCAGQCLTELWYFSSQKAISNKPLYHLYDKADKEVTPDPLWQDNPNGIKFTTVIQKDQDNYWMHLWNDYYREIQKEFNDSPNFYEAYTRIGIEYAAASMLVTKEPHYIIIADQTETNSHAIICYEYDYAAGEFKVADPNSPGNKSKAVTFANGSFNTYYSGENANTSTAYTKFAFFGKSALMNMSTIGFYWSKLVNGTIGEDIFPKTEYKYLVTVNGNEEEYELENSLPYTKDVSYKIKCSVTPKGGSTIANKIRIYNGTNSLVDSYYDNNGYVELTLTEDLKDVTVGILIYTIENGFEKWIDFKWVKISELRIEPEKFYGEKNKEYKWQAIISVPPVNARYEWNFGDGTSTQIVKNNKEVKHTYQKDGIYPLILSLYDDTKNTIISVASTYVIIGSGILTANYKVEPSWLYASDYKPILNVAVNGTLSGNDLTFVQSSDYIYAYYATAPTQLMADINVNYSFEHKKLTYNTGNTEGIIKMEWEFETLNSFSYSWDAGYTLLHFDNVVIDTSGTRFYYKANDNNPDITDAYFTMNAKYRIKSTEYYKSQDGTESTKEYIIDEEYPAFMLVLALGKK